MSQRATSTGPRQFAVLMLASGDYRPRQRARDQQADIAGGDLKARILRRLVELDPPAEKLIETCELIIGEVGEPTGGSRAIARQLIEDYAQVEANPQFIDWLIDQALWAARENQSSHHAPREEPQSAANGTLKNSISHGTGSSRGA